MVYHLFVYSGVEIRKRLRGSVVAWMGGRRASDALVLSLFLAEFANSKQNHIVSI